MLEFRFEMIGPVHESCGVWILTADLVQGGEEGVLRELLRADPRGAGKVGGRGPAFELGGALRLA
jgi:hypothetical protein